MRVACSSRVMLLCGRSRGRVVPGALAHRPQTRATMPVAGGEVAWHGHAMLSGRGLTGMVRDGRDDERTCAAAEVG
jgi:hypothetical protein